MTVYFEVKLKVQVSYHSRSEDLCLCKDKDKKFLDMYKYVSFNFVVTENEFGTSPQNKI